MAEDFVLVGNLDDIAENESKAFDITGRSILVCNTKDGIFAVENRCSHQLHTLEGGKIRSCYIFCPLHGQRFNLKNGMPIGKLTDKPVQTYPVKAEAGKIYISPYPLGAEQD